MNTIRTRKKVFTSTSSRASRSSSPWTNLISGTGWPSFTKPADPENVVEKIDKGIFTSRTEVRSKHADSHLGHVFDDGPKDRGGKRYCMNSAAMRFIPKSEMEKEGYGAYLAQF